MKTKKLKLESLKIESFVTKLNAEKSSTLNGGKPPIPVESDGAPGASACLKNCTYNWCG